MPIKVLVVDDSSFFRRRVTEILNADPALEVIATATNGREAVAKAQSERPDVITMDIEMPIMDGISAVRAIMAQSPVPVMMFSSLTHNGARATLDALDAGAADFLPKRFEDIANDQTKAAQLLQQRVKAIAHKRVAKVSRFAGSTHQATLGTEPRKATARPTVPTARPQTASTAAAQSKPAASSSASPSRASGKRYKVLLVGTSTGGPVALQNILTQFPQNYPHPILLVQHMPAAFTPAFAQRLNGLSKIEIKEAEHGERLRPGVAYLAPGGKQMLLEGNGSNARVVIREGDQQINYKPSVDITFGSAARVYGGDTLAVILTGMGADGREGCRLLKRHGATIWAQDEASCVVYGMPQAVTAAGISSHSIPLTKMAESILRESAGR